MSKAGNAVFLETAELEVEIDRPCAVDDIRDLGSQFVVN